jgi:hypothetical protein
MAIQVILELVIIACSEETAMKKQPGVERHYSNFGLLRRYIRSPRLKSEAFGSLLEGRIAIIVDNTPFVLIVPVTSRLEIRRRF